MDEKGQTLKVAGTAGTPNNDIARNDIMSLLPANKIGDKYRAALSIAKDGNVFLNNAETFKGSEDPGVQLVYNSVMAKEDYVYEVSETGSNRWANNKPRDGYEAGKLQIGKTETVNLKTGETSNQIINASLTVKGGADDDIYQIPVDPKVEGHVTIAPSTGSIRKFSDISKPKPRASIVFHEMAEIYNRTTLKMPYHGGAGIGAHKTAIESEKQMSIGDLRRDVGGEGSGRNIDFKK